MCVLFRLKQMETFHPRPEFRNLSFLIAGYALLSLTNLSIYFRNFVELWFVEIARVRVLMHTRSVCGRYRAIENFGNQQTVCASGTVGVPTLKKIQAKIRIDLSCDSILRMRKNSAYCDGDCCSLMQLEKCIRLSSLDIRRRERSTETCFNISSIWCVRMWQFYGTWKNTLMGAENTCTQAHNTHTYIQTHTHAKKNVSELSSVLKGILIEFSFARKGPPKADPPSTVTFQNCIQLIHAIFLNRHGSRCSR